MTFLHTPHSLQGGSEGSSHGALAGSPTLLSPGDTHGHGVVERVVVDTGAQGGLQQTALKELQGLRHLLMEVLCRLIRDGEVQVVGVEPVGDGQKALRGRTAGTRKLPRLPELLGPTPVYTRPRKTTGCSR